MQYSGRGHGAHEGILMTNQPHITFTALWQKWLGLTKPQIQKCFQCDPQHFQLVAINFKVYSGNLYLLTY